MIKEIDKTNNPQSKEELDGFARYLGIEYEDLYELNYKKSYKEDIDFDDYSR